MSAEKRGVFYAVISVKLGVGNLGEGGALAQSNLALRKCPRSELEWLDACAMIEKLNFLTCSVLSLETWSR